MNVVSRFLFRLSKSSAHYLVTTCFFVNFFGQLFNQPLGAKSKHTHNTKLPILICSEMGTQIPWS